MILQVLWTPCETLPKLTPMRFRSLASPGDHTGQVSLEQLVEVRMRFRVSGVRRCSFSNPKKCCSLFKPQSTHSKRFAYISGIQGYQMKWYPSNSGNQIWVHFMITIEIPVLNSKRRRDVFNRRFLTGSTSRHRVSKPLASDGHWRGTQTEISFAYSWSDCASPGIPKSGSRLWTLLLPPAESTSFIEGSLEV